MPKKTRAGTESSGALRPVPPPGGVTVRMYAPGFGDCFLLAFRGDDDKPRYMLIDCGVHTNYPGGKERALAVARDIADTCNGKLDVVAVTHEHTDHIYGFQYGQEAFRDMTIGELWLAWTEDPENRTAASLGDLSRRSMDALQAATQHLEAAGSPHAAKIRAIFGFETAAAAADKVRGNREIMEALRSWYGRQPDLPKSYCVPGRRPLEIPGVKGIRCYVLGPPEDIAAIRKLENRDEMYFGRQPLSPLTVLLSAVAGMSETGMSGDWQEIRGYPFDLRYSISAGEAENGYDGFFRNHYGFSDTDGEPWRRIDTDWLESAADDLALNIGSYTNNTSLVLAIALENGDDRRVLLFPGDAQAGNWLSWQNVSWKEKGTDGGTDGRTLLGQTVLYKTGHHGSSNATMKANGLELMKSRDLVAMIPVDEEWAESKQGWIHPDPKVLSALMEKTRGRILRSDRIPKGDSLQAPEGVREDTWGEFIRGVDWDRGPERLWIQFTVS